MTEGKEKHVNRWLILAASVIINLIAGTNFAWSVYSIPLQEQFGWGAAEVTMVFTINSSIVLVGYLLAGWLVDRISVKLAVGLGAILTFIGLMLSGFASNLMFLYIGYGFINGIGSSMTFSACIANVQKWFPDRRGIASSINTVGFGLGSVIAAPILANAIAAIGPLPTFRITAVVYAVVQLLMVLIVKTAPVDYKPEGWNPPGGAEEAMGRDWTPKEVLTNKMYYIIFVIYFFIGFSGQVVIALGSPIGQQMYGMEPLVAAVFVSIITAGNTTGRILFGTLSDYIGRYNSMLVMYVVELIGAVVLVLTSGTSMYWAYGVAGFCLGCAFGGTASVMPAITSETWGPKHFGVNYALVFICFALFSFTAPQAATASFQSTGSYDVICYIIVGFVVVGTIMNIACRRFLVDRKWDQIKAKRESKNTDQ